MVGNTLQSRLDLPLWSKAALDASKNVKFFTTPGLSNISSIDQALTIDKTAQYTCEQIQVAIMPTAAGGWTDVLSSLLAQMIQETYFVFLKNGREYVWSIASASLLSIPVPIVAGPPSIPYDISRSVLATYSLAEPIIIPGGQAINITQQWETATSFVGLTTQFTMFGILDRDIARGKGI